MNRRVASGYLAALLKGEPPHLAACRLCGQYLEEGDVYVLTEGLMLHQACLETHFGAQSPDRAALDAHVSPPCRNRPCEDAALTAVVKDACVRRGLRLDEGRYVLRIGKPAARRTVYSFAKRTGLIRYRRPRGKLKLGLELAETQRLNEIINEVNAHGYRIYGAP